MNAANPFSNPFIRSLSELRENKPVQNPFISTIQPAAIKSLESESVAKVQKLMQEILATYSHVVLAGPTVPANTLYLKAAFQHVEFEVLKITLTVMPRLSAEDKLQIFNAVQHTWNTIAANAMASLQQMNNDIASLYSRVVSDAQAMQSPVTIVQMLYVMNFSEFFKQIAITAFNSLHCMRRDMVTAGSVR